MSTRDKFNSLFFDNFGIYIEGQGNSRVPIIFNFPNIPEKKNTNIQNISSCAHNFVFVELTQNRSADEAESAKYICSLCKLVKIE